MKQLLCRLTPSVLQLVLDALRFWMSLEIFLALSLTWQKARKYMLGHVICDTHVGHGMWAGLTLGIAKDYSVILQFD